VLGQVHAEGRGSRLHRSDHEQVRFSTHHDAASPGGRARKWVDD
jgi:hypothetical protein